MENLPIDVLRIVLSLLSIESILPSKRVCKTWRMLLDEVDIKVGLLFAFTRESLSTLQLCYGDNNPCGGKTILTKLDRAKHTAPNSNAFMVGSCNGLVCFTPPRYAEKGYVALICNPMTGECIQIDGFRKHRPNTRLLLCGFGYVRSTNEYKVVGMDCDYIYVNTIGRRRRWRRIGKKIFRLPFPSNDEIGIFANGALHWSSWNYPEEPGKQLRIVAFDLAEEKFRPISSPPPMMDYRSGDLNVEEAPKLLLLGGNLCCVHTDIQLEYLDIWMFKKAMRSNGGITKEGQRSFYYEETWSWTKFSTISWDDRHGLQYTPISITRSNTILLWESSMGHLCSFDPTTSKILEVWDSGSPVQIVPHMNTFVSLKDL